MSGYRNSVAIAACLLAARPAPALAGAADGLDRPSPGTVRLGLLNRFQWRQSGAGDDFELDREDRLLAFGQWSPLEALLVQVEVPFVVWHQLTEPSGSSVSATGLGDLSLGLRVELLRSNPHAVALFGSLKAPTGALQPLPDSTVVSELRGRLRSRRPGLSAALDEHQRVLLGSGSWDGLFGAAWSFKNAPFTLFADARARVNGANTDGFRRGNALLFGLGARRDFLEGGQLVLTLEAQLRSAGRDAVPGGDTDANSGGQLGSAILGAGYRLHSQWWILAAIQMPVLSSLNGTQAEHPQLSLGLSFDWSI